MLQRVKLWLLFGADYMFASIMLLEDINMLIRILATFLGATLTTYTIIKVRQDIKLKKQQSDILKVIKEKHDRELYDMMLETEERNKSKEISEA